jgi:hypothetical protein
MCDASSANDDILKHGMQVGLVCNQWAYLEWLVEVTHWWLIGLLNKPIEGRIITGGLSIEQLLKRVCSLSHLRINVAADREALEAIKKRVDAVADERHLAVHGVRAVQPDNRITGIVSRGNYKGQPQQLSTIRLGTLNTELAAIIDELEPLLHRLGIIQGTIEQLRQQRPAQPEQ